MRADAVTGTWDGSRLHPDPILTYLDRRQGVTAETSAPGRQPAAAAGCSAEHHPPASASAVGAEPDVGCSAEHHPAPSPRSAERPQPASPRPAAGRSLEADRFTFTHDDIDRWAACVERMNREAKLEHAIWIDD